MEKSRTSLLRISFLIILPIFIFFLFGKEVKAETVITEQALEDTTVSATTQQPFFLFVDDDWPTSTMTFNSVKFKFAANNSLDLNYAKIALNTDGAEGGNNVSSCTALDFTFKERTFAWNDDQVFSTSRTYAEFDFYFYDTEENCESGSALSFNPIDVQFRGLGDHVYLPNSLMGIEGSFPTFTPYFVLGSDFPFGELKITSPPTDSFYTLGTVVNISGTCITNGTDRLQLTSTTNFVFPEAFDIDCVDHAWDKDYVVPNFRNTVTIVDLSWNGQSFPDQQTNDNIVITGTTGDTGFNLSILYPECTNGTQCTNLKESTTKWIFRFAYRVPSDDLLSKVKYYLQSGCDNDYDNCSVEESGFISDLDTTGNGYIDSIAGSVQVDGTQRYYRAELVNDDTSALEYSIVFTTKASTAETALDPKAPDDLGYWGNIIRTLFLPSKNSMTTFAESVTDDLRTRIPFGYFYAISDRMKTVDATASPLVVNANFSIASTAFSIPMFNSDAPHFQDIFGALAPYFTIAIWLGVVLYLYHRIRDFDL